MGNIQKMKKQFDSWVKDMGMVVFVQQGRSLLILTSSPDDVGNELDAPDSPFERLFDGVNGMWNFNVADENKVYWVPHELTINVETNSGFIILESQENQRVALTFEQVVCF